MIGVLVMAYGTPASRDDIQRYYTDIRRGRPPSAEQLADLTARYDAIGGIFPLLAISQAQAAGLAAWLGPSYAVELAFKHSHPRIEDGVAALGRRGAASPVGLVLAPHYSRASVGEYAARAKGVDVVESWHLLPAYVDFLAGAVQQALRDVPAGSTVVFTAHSLPQRAVASGDPYAEQVRETAAAVAERAGLDRWSTAWQSAGRTPEPWLEPDIGEVIRDLDAPGVVVCPCGFTADHLEVRYDLDIEAAGIAAERGLPFARTRSMNADASVLRALAALVASRAAGHG